MQKSRLRHRALAVGQDRLFASDPNLGRILAAIGYADIEALHVDGVRVWLGSNGEEVLVAENGGRAESYREEDGARIMAETEITVRVNLGRGSAKGTVYSCVIFRRLRKDQRRLSELVLCVS